MTETGGTASISVLVTVNSLKVTFKVSVNFHPDAATAGPSPWNNLGSYQAGANLSNMKDGQSDATGMNLTLLDTWGGDGNQGEASGILSWQCDEILFFIPGRKVPAM